MIEFLEEISSNQLALSTLRNRLKTLEIPLLQSQTVSDTQVRRLLTPDLQVLKQTIPILSVHTQNI